MGDNLDPNTGTVEGEAPSAPDAEQSAAAAQEGGQDNQQEIVNQLTKQSQDAAVEAAYWRGIAQGKETPAPKTQEEKVELNPDDFNSDTDYLRAVADQTRNELRAEIESENVQRKNRERNQEIMSQYEEGRKEHPDFDSVALAPNIPVTQTMFDAALGNKLSSVLYYFGKNPGEAARISALPPTMQIKEVGRIEGALASSPPSKTKTNAPDPPTKLGGHAPSSSKKEADMTRAELHAKWEADRRAKAGV